MPDPDYKALCKELADTLDYWLKNSNLTDSDARDLVQEARAALAQPEPVAPTDDPAPSGYAYRYPTMDGSVVRFNHGQEVNGCRPLYAIPYWLGQPPARPAIEPVPVSERLPGPEDCLDEGWAWFFNQRIGWRQAVLPVSPGYTHWLPAHALPTPEALPND